MLTGEHLQWRGLQLCGWQALWEVLQALNTAELERLRDYKIKKHTDITVYLPEDGSF